MGTTKNVGLRLSGFDLENGEVGWGGSYFLYFKQYQGEKFDLFSIVVKMNLVTRTCH